MKAFITEAGDIDVRLSRRNLEALLAKLNGHPPDSVRTLMRNVGTDGDGQVGERWLVVVAEDNESHYNGRRPGALIAATDSQISHQ